MTGDFFSSDETPTPFRFLTQNFSFLYNTPRPFTGGSTGSSLSGTTCTGYARTSTFGYGADRLSIESNIPAGTTLVYRRSGSEWYELIGSLYGDYIRASAVTDITCLGSSTGSTIYRATSTPRRSTNNTDVVCQVIGSSDDPIPVYLERNQSSEENGELTARSRFLAIRHDNSWYQVTGITTRQARGYVHSSDIDVLNCRGDVTQTPRPTVTPTIPFGG